MKNPVLIIIGIIIAVALGMQTFMFYQIQENLEQRYNLEKKLDLSSLQGSDTWVQDANNWNPYQELFQMRHQIEQLFEQTMSRFHKNPNIGSNIRMSAIKLKDEADRYVVIAHVPAVDESSINVALNGRQLIISVKTESVNEQKNDDDNDQYQRIEKFSGSFQSLLTLPGDVNKEAMKTEYNKGVLTITLPKA